jgi:hypothetical protein
VVPTAPHLRNITERLPRTRALDVGVSIILRAGDIAPKCCKTPIFSANGTLMPIALGAFLVSRNKLRVDRSRFRCSHKSFFVKRAVNRAAKPDQQDRHEVVTMGQPGQLECHAASG